MAPSRPPTARIAAGALAVVVAVACATPIVQTTSRLDDLVTTLAVLGAVATAGGVLFAFSSLGVLGAAFLGAAFCASRFEAPHTVDLAVVALAPALLLLCELVSWSADERVRVRGGVPQGVRAATIAAAVLGAGAITAVIASIATLPVGDALVLAALAVAAMVLLTLTILSSATP